MSCQPPRVTSQWFSNRSATTVQQNLTEAAVTMPLSITGGSCHKYIFVITKRFATKVCLLWQNFCRDKHIFVMCLLFVMTKLCLPQKSVVKARILLSQQKTCFVATKDLFCHDKPVFVATNFCHDKNYTCGSSCQWYLNSMHRFVATKLLSWQKWYLWQLPPIYLRGMHR